MPPSTQTRRIIVKADVSGGEDLKKLSSQLGQVTKNTKNISTGFNQLRAIFAGFIGLSTIRTIARMSDDMQNLGNRLRIVSKEGEKVQDTIQGILDVANETKQSITATGEVYTRLAVAMKSAGGSAESMLALTKVLINSFRIAGSTNTETTSTIIQLSQAFASGTLRGQELRSVLLQNATLAGLLRDKFGAGLAAAAEKGLIKSSDVMILLRDNMIKINKAALILAPTFEQVVTTSFNTLTVAIGKLNEQFKGSELFGKAAETFIKKLSLIGAIIGVIALTRIPALIVAIKSLSVTMIALATKNPLLLAMIALSTILLSTVDTLDDLIDKIRNVGAWFAFLGAEAIETGDKINIYFVKGLNLVGLKSDQISKKIQENAARVKELRDLADKLGAPRNKAKGIAEGGDTAEIRALEDLIRRQKLLEAVGAADTKKAYEFLAALNKEWSSGALLISDYNNKLLDYQKFKLDKEFKDGKIDLEKYNEGLNSISENKYNDKLREGLITLEKYQENIRSLKIEELTAKFESGKITLAKYNDELVKISDKFLPESAFISGANAYIESVGTLSEGIAGAIKNVFTGLENKLFDFIKTGKASFKDFTQAILDDLTRIIIRAQIVAPIANGLIGSFATAGAGASTGSQATFGTTSQPLAATGLAFDKGMKQFATGGIVDGATMFGYGTNKTGIMGEAGPEAILPLQRGKGGNLGVAASVTPVTVNVINQSGNETQQTETTGPNGERQIEILISNRVKEGIATGRFDTAFQQSFGLNRRGV